MSNTHAGPNAPNYAFASDHTAGVCPEAWSALAEANRGRVPSYGADPWTERLGGLMRALFEAECETFLVSNGTAANALALSAMAAPYASIFCHETSHVDTDECSAPEFFTGGSKVIPVPGPGGRLRLAELERALIRGRGVSFPKPGALSVTQATEWGGLYRHDELKGLAGLASARGLGVHMDGARFANAAAALREREGASPADLTWRAGVDILCFGGTKNGIMSSEAIVVFNPKFARDFAYRMKRAGQLASKMRYASAQWVAMLESGAWLANGARANAQAARLAAALARLPGVKLLQPVEANSLFVEMPAAAAASMEAKGWHFYRFIGENGYRLVCSWETRDDDVNGFAADLKAALAALS